MRIARDPGQNAERYVALERNPPQKTRAPSCGEEPRISKASYREKEPAPPPRKGAMRCPREENDWNLLMKFRRGRKLEELKSRLSAKSGTRHRLRLRV